MYFWNIEALKAQLVQGPLSDRQVLPYLVAYSVLIAAIGLIPGYSMNTWDFIGAGWSVVLAVVGTLYVYRQNGGGSGQHLLQRYLAIGWVVSIRWVAAMVAVVAVYYGFIEAFSQASEVTTWPEVLVLAAAETALYWRMGHHVFQVAQARRDDSLVRSWAQ